MKVTIAVYHDSKWLEAEVWPKEMPIPRIGEMVSVESFFPNFLKDDWELSLGIEPFLTVTNIVWFKHEAQIELQFK